MNKILAGVSLYISVCCSCNLNQSMNNAVTKDEDVVNITDTTIGKVEIYDASASELIDRNATIEIIGRNYTWSEGPVWIESQNILLFSDVPENKIYSWQEGDTPTVFLTPSGYTGNVKRIGGEDGANGLALDNQGRLLLCQSGNRQVVQLNSSYERPVPQFTVLSANYQGKKFNSPNDLVTDSRNNIFFTDPIYGLPQREKDSTRELSFEGVYKIGANGKTILLIDSIKNPNGIGMSPDEKTLYVGSSNAVHPGWYAYSIDTSGSIIKGGLFIDGTKRKETASVQQGADGFKIDRSGNIFSSGPDGINIFSSAGKLLALIKIYNRPTSNCAFNTKGDLLFVTADDLLLKITLHPKE